MLQKLLSKLGYDDLGVDAALVGDEQAQALVFTRAILGPGAVLLFVWLMAPPSGWASRSLVADSILLILLGWCIGGMVILRRRPGCAVGAWSSVLVWIGATILTWRGQGVRDAAVVLQVLAFLVAALVGCPRLTLLLVLATIANSLSMGLAEHAGLVGFAPDEPLGVTRDVTLLVTMIGVLILLYARGIRLSRERVRIELAERLRAEEERNELFKCEREARAQAEEAILAKDRFIATLSHELRTPLTPVLMTLSSMENDADVTPARQQEARLMRQSIEIELRLIDDLLDLSRAKFGKLRMKARPCEIRGVLDDVIHLCRSEMNGRSIELVRHYHDEQSHVLGDGDRLRQVFWNLLRNATKFTPCGGQILVRTSTLLEDQGSFLRVEISDTGCGIESELMPRLFGLFQQGTTQDLSHTGGLGVGLAISKAIVDHHRGRVFASNNAPKPGATFRVDLPCDAPAPMTILPELTDAPASAARVLLVEDDRLTAAVFNKALTSLGHRVTRVRSCAEAVSMIEAGGEFDLLVSDIGLPDGSGLELMPLFARACSNRGIAISGYGTEQDLTASAQAGFCLHLVKPVSLEQLASAIRDVLGEAKTADQAV